MRIGIYVSGRGRPDVASLLARFERAEEAGLQTVWVSQLFDYDALTVLALAGRATSRIELGTWVVPTFPRHPSALAQQALSVQAASGGRLALGIGLSHRAVIEKRLGLDYSKPVRHMREYLSVLNPLLRGDSVRFDGEQYRVSLALDVPVASPPPVLVGALGPQMLGLAGRSADGVAIWLGGPRYLEEFALPRVRRAAQQAGRPAPRIVCGLPVAVTRERAAARAAAARLLAQSSRLPSYRAVLEREGAAVRASGLLSTPAAPRTWMSCSETRISPCTTPRRTGRTVSSSSRDG